MWPSACLLAHICWYYRQNKDLNEGQLCVMAIFLPCFVESAWDSCHNGSLLVCCLYFWASVWIIIVRTITLSINGGFWIHKCSPWRDEISHLWSMCVAQRSMPYFKVKLKNWSKTACLDHYHTILYLLTLMPLGF